MQVSRVAARSGCGQLEKAVAVAMLPVAKRLEGNGGRVKAAVALTVIPHVCVLQHCRCHGWKVQPRPRNN